MPLTPLDPNEDRTFLEGEQVFDVDGNVYTVREGRAHLNKNDDISYSIVLPDERNCFTRNPAPGFTAERADGKRFQIVMAQNRGDACYEDKRGIYFHLLTDKSAIDTGSIQGPFESTGQAYAHAVGNHGG